MPWGPGAAAAHPRYRQGPRPSGRAQCPRAALQARGIHPAAERHLPAGRAVGRDGRRPVLSARRAGWRRLRRRGGRAPPVPSCGLQRGQRRPRGASSGPPRRSPSSPTGGARWRGGAPGSPPPAPEHPPAQIVPAGSMVSRSAPTAPPSCRFQSPSGPWHPRESVGYRDQSPVRPCPGEIAPPASRVSSPAAAGALGWKEEAGKDCSAPATERWERASPGNCCLVASALRDQAPGPRRPSEVSFNKQTISVGFLPCANSQSRRDPWSVWL